MMKKLRPLLRELAHLNRCWMETEYLLQNTQWVFCGLMAELHSSCDWGFHWSGHLYEDRSTMELNQMWAYISVHKLFAHSYRESGFSRLKKGGQELILLEHLLCAAAAKSLQLCPTLCDPLDGSPPGSPVPGILQARTLEWVDISFSHAWKWKVKVKSLSCVQLLATPWTAAYQAPPSMGFSRG